jgi:hypothetical protein
MSENREPTASRRRAAGLAHAGNLTKWKPGQSGNPTGRAKADVDIAALARQYGPACIEVCAKLLSHKEPKWRLAAATALLDRGFGKPRQETSIDTKDDRSFTFLHLVAARASGEQLRAAMTQLNAPRIGHSEDGPIDLMSPAVE